MSVTDTRRIRGAKAVAPAVADEEEQFSLLERFQAWVLHDSPSWLISTIFHTILLLVVGLLMGRSVVEKVIGDAPIFEAIRPEEPPETKIERFELGEAPLDPTELTTESLTMNEPPGQVAQEAMYYDDSPVFEEQGGGIPTGSETGAGGLGFNIKASGLGPVLRGGGGAEAGKGTGTGFGRGGAGTGFGGRGKGHREALLGRYGGTKQSERAVAAALNWLARHQSADGSWSIQKYNGRCTDGTCKGAGNTESRAAATALGLLPFLAAGQTHQSKGPYQQVIAKAIRWLIQNQKPNGDLSGGEHQMYAHGLAAIALCEAYGMSGESNVGRAAQAAIQFIQSGQNEQGGWRYLHASKDGDTSVFGWQMMALKSGMMAGLSVDPQKFELGRKWLELVAAGGDGTSQGLGQFCYLPEPKRGTPCMSSVGLLITQYLGAARSDPTMVGGAQYLMANQPKSEDRDVYYWYYATQVMHNLCGPDWDTWNRGMRRLLIETQCKSGCASGSWDPDAPTKDRWGGSGGRLMVTSLSCLTLEIYYRYLPLYQLDAEKGEGAKKPAAEKPPADKPAADDKKPTADEKKPAEK